MMKQLKHKMECQKSRQMGNDIGSEGINFRQFSLLQFKKCQKKVRGKKKPEIISKKKLIELDLMFFIAMHIHLSIARFGAIIACGYMMKMP